MEALHIVAALVLAVIMILVGYSIYGTTIDSAKENVGDSEDEVFGSEEGEGDVGFDNYLDTGCERCSLEVKAV